MTAPPTAIRGAGHVTDPRAMTWSALVLAGNRRADCPVAAAAGVSHKALATVAGRPMIERVIAALRAVPTIGTIAVAIEDPDLLRTLPGLDPDGIRILQAAKSPSLSALAGVQALDGPVLMTTADTPLVTPEILAHFLDRQPGSADATVGLARVDLVKAAYPDAIRTGLRFADGARSGCNLFAFHTTRAIDVLRFWRRVEENRKRPLAMLRQVGTMATLRYASGTLTLDAALAALGQRTGTTLAAVDMPFAEAAIDVDKPADLALAERILSAREPVTPAGP
ncbi:MAG: nucleotidyltransferase family protein [Pseudomonadota bacterium]